MELWDAYNRDGSPRSEVLVRGEPLPEGCYHLVGCVLVRHMDGRFLLLLRSPEKKACPNAWEIGTGGSALRGEDSETCARRELREETGITDGTLTFLDRFVEDEHQCIYDGYLCVTAMDSDAIRLQPGETAAYRWVTEPEFLAFFRSEHCIPLIRRRLQKYVDSLAVTVDEPRKF